ncbi:hypothetical protein ACHAXN_001511 [Cyclotella atomus]
MASSWTEESNLGASSYSSNNYPDALVHYTNALDTLLNSSSGDAVEITEIEKKKQHQILLSNVIACRLKIGGEEMVERALVEARECIAINPNWAKAHIRLASAYIAQGGHSNDACQALQRAISLDRENKVAREMLVKELRRRDNCGSSSSSSCREGNTSANAGDNDGATVETAQQTNAGHSSTAPSSSAQQQNTNAPTSSTSNNNQNNLDIDDIYHQPHHNQPNSLSELMQQYLTRAISWYHSQSDDKKTLLKVSFCFLLLYIALGGRFGLEYAVGQNHKKRGNYGQGNVYERYNNYNNRQSYGDGHYYGQRREAAQTADEYHYNRQSSVYNDRSNPRNEEYYSHGQGSAQGRQSSQSSSGYSGSTDRENANANARDGNRYNDGSNPSGSNEQYYSQHNNNDNRQRQSSTYHNSDSAQQRAYNDRNNRRNDRYYERYDEYPDYSERPRSRSSRSSFGMPNLFDGSFQSMGILFIIGVVCHRLGINPGQVLFMLNMANRRGGVHRPGGMYGRRGFGAGGFGGAGVGPGVGFRFGGGRNRFGRRY